MRKPQLEKENDVRNATGETPADRPTAVEILEDAVGLSAGLGVLLLPLLTLAVPGVLVFLVLPGLLLLAAAAVPAAIAAAVIAPP